MRVEGVKATVDDNGATPGPERAPNCKPMCQSFHD